MTEQTRSQAQFQEWVEQELLTRVKVLLHMKGSQYTGIQASAFQNFERSAVEWDTTVHQEILRAAQKHWTYLIKSTKDEINEDHQHIEQAAMDLIVYMMLELYWWDYEAWVDPLKGK